MPRSARRKARPRDQGNEGTTGTQAEKGGPDWRGAWLGTDDVAAMLTETLHRAIAQLDGHVSQQADTTRQ